MTGFPIVLWSNNCFWQRCNFIPVIKKITLVHHQCIAVGRILDKAKPTGSFLDLVQPHHYAFDIAGTREQLVYLFFGGIECQVPHIQSCAVKQKTLLLSSTALKQVKIQSQQFLRQ